MTKVTATEKYADGPRRVCDVCGRPMIWNATTRRTAGGYWVCLNTKGRARANLRRAEKRYEAAH